MPYLQDAILTKKIFSNEKVKTSIIKSCKMKQFFFLLFLLVIIGNISAQNVGIGTPTPNISAQLDISSNNKGLLIPRMTTSQRLGISSPANGLMVYDTDKNELYHHNGTSWRPILNGEYWVRGITARNRIGNSSDSVGIGLLSPTEWLDVDGNIRTRNNLIADNTVTGGTLVSTGNLVTVGTSTLTGNVTSFGDMILNNPSATLQLRDGSSVNKGFVQLSGNNLRMGTNSGNDAGNMIIRMDGTDRIFINPSGNMGLGDPTPTHKLEVNGDINFTGEIRKVSQSGLASLTPYCYGFVKSNGTVELGTGNYSSQRLQTGVYNVTVPGITFANSIVIASSRFRSRIIIGSSDENGVIQFVVTNLDDQEVDTDFYFIVYRL
jgi:hypothetical protein